MSDMEDEKKEIIKDFINETRDRLDDAEPKIIQMEKIALELGKIDVEIINDVFRLFHTLKSNSAFFELHTISAVMHEAETLLDLFRKEEIIIEALHIDIIYMTTDFIKKAIAGLETTISDEPFEKEALILMEEIRKAIEKGAPGTVSPVKIQPRQKKKPAKKAPAAQENKEEKAPAENSLIDPEMINQFAASLLESMDKAKECLKKISAGVDVIENAETAEREFHTAKGNAGFLSLPEIEKAGRCGQNAMESILEKGDAAGSKVPAMLLRLADAVKVMAKSLTDKSGRSMPNIENLINAIEDAQDAKGPVKAQAEAGVRTAAEKTPAEQATALANGIQTSIRVDVEKLDMLLDLVGELVIAEAMVQNSDELIGRKLEKLDKSLSHMDKITRDIQEVSMSMRMIPLASTFNKMPRVVRDISYKVGKKVEIEIIGEETEVDKTIIELINDPLVHIIRNAVDHGLETPEKRRELGKPEQGLIKIEAKHSAGEVWISIEDDGKGLDRGKILKKAIERGLINPAEADDMKESDVWKIIFMPGFSTADKVSDVSGRGVGLDVVQRNIEKMRGKIDVKTMPGKGTTFIVRIPLTLAIIEGMVMRVGNSRYTIPISSIKNSFRPKAEQLTQLPGRQEVVTLRGKAVPVVRLHEVYKIIPTHTNLTDGILIMVESEDKRCCIFVDEIFGQQQIVIKGLSSYLGHVRGVSGCAILGDGDISMILDVAELIKSTEEIKIS